MEVFTLLENWEEILESGSKVPFSTKVMVDAGELRDIIEEIRLKLPDELKQAKWVKEERQRIISDAELEAQKVLKETEVYDIVTQVYIWANISFKQSSSTTAYNLISFPTSSLSKSKSSSNSANDSSVKSSL